MVRSKKKEEVSLLENGIQRTGSLHSSFSWWDVVAGKSSDYRATVLLPADDFVLTGLRRG